MIKITKLLDIWKAEQIPKYIADSMENQMLELCKEYLVEDISEFGAFWYVESKADLDNYEQTGMTERIEMAQPEFLKVHKGENGKVCMQGCYIISDDYSIYVFCENITLNVNV